MEIEVNWSLQVSEKFPELAICMETVNGVRIEKDNEQLHSLKKIVYEEVRDKHGVDTLRNDPTVRAYRSFYWKLDIDPTKTRPSGEALLRRVLHGGELPNISTAVDAYNLASMKTIIPISGFNRDLLKPPFQIRFAKIGEAFIGIGMKVPIILTKKTLVLADEKQILCVYPYRDCDATKITEKSRNVLIVGYGSPGVTEPQLKEAVETTVNYIKQVAQGKTDTAKVFSCKPM